MKIILLTLILLTQLSCDQNSSSALGAKQAVQTPIKSYKQKDGSSFRGILRGKEFFNYIQLENGYTVLYNPKSQQYEYAQVKEGRLHPSGITVQKGKQPKGIVKIPQQTLQQLETDAFKKHF